MQSCLVLDVQMLCEVTSHPNIVNPEKVDLYIHFIRLFIVIDASLDRIVQSSGDATVTVLTCCAASARARAVPGLVTHSQPLQEGGYLSWPGGPALATSA